MFFSDFLRFLSYVLQKPAVQAARHALCCRLKQENRLSMLSRKMQRNRYNSKHRIASESLRRDVGLTTLATLATLATSIEAQRELCRSWTENLRKTLDNWKIWKPHDLSQFSHDRVQHIPASCRQAVQLCIDHSLSLLYMLSQQYDDII